MAISANAIARGAVAAVGVILLAIATQARWAGQPALAAEAPPVAPAPSIVAGGGVTLHSVSVNFPHSDSTFPGGREADAINNDCLICHSAGMVLDQASLSRAGWQGIVDQMRNDFKAPFAAEDTPAIVDYLVNLKNVMSQSAGRQPDAKHGAVIVAQGTAAGAPPCAQCHAFNGVSDASGAFPRLAGQSAYYLAEQLRDFASGVRASAIMSPIAKALSPDDIADVTAYFAGVNAPFLPLKAPDAALVKRGEELAKVGEPESRLQLRQLPWTRRRGRAAGDPVPRRDNTPTTSPSPCRCGSKVSARTVPTRWRSIAKKLDDQEIAAVAAYYQQVQLAARERRSRKGRSKAMPTDEPHHSAADRPEHVAAPIGPDEARRGAAGTDRSARSSSPASPWRCSSSAGWPSISSSSCREGPLAEPPSNPLQRPLPDGVVPGSGRRPHRGPLGHDHGGDARRHDGGHRRHRRRRRAAPVQQCRGHRAADACISAASSSRAISARRSSPTAPPRCG